MAIRRNSAFLASFYAKAEYRRHRVRFSVVGPQHEHSTSAACGGKTSAKTAIYCLIACISCELYSCCFYMAASLANAGVCILSASAPQPQVDAAGLQAKGLRVRTVSTCVADVLLASASLAMLVIPSADLEPGAAGADRQWARCNI